MSRRGEGSRGLSGVALALVLVVALGAPAVGGAASIGAAPDGSAPGMASPPAGSALSGVNGVAENGSADFSADSTENGSTNGTENGSTNEPSTGLVVGETETLTGVAMDWGVGERDLREFVARSLGRNRTSLPPHAFAFVWDEETAIVLSEDEPTTGRGTVTARVLASSAEAGRAYNIMVANRTEIESVGEPASLEAVVANLSAYRHRLVRVDASFRRAGSVSLGEHGPTQTLGYGQLGGNQLQDRLIRYPGLTARRAVHTGPAAGVQRAVGVDVYGDLLTRDTSESYWVDANASVSGFVFDDTFPAFGSSTSGLVVSDVSLQAERIASLASLRERSAGLEGEVVTLRTNVTGERLSGAHVIGDPRCFRIGVYSNVTDGCEPIGTDVTVHGGVLFDRSPTAWSAVVPYAAVSNHVQVVPATDRRGTYRVTGRVVDADQIDPRLQASHALLVYDMERTGDLGVNETVAGHARPWGRVVTDLLRWQLTADHGQLEAFYRLTRNETDGEDGQESITVGNVSFGSRDVVAGSPVTLSVTVKNEGEASREVALRVHEGATVYDQATVSLAAGESRTVDFEFAIFRVGEHALAVNNRSVGTVTVAGGTDVTGAAGDDGGVMGGLGVAPDNGAIAIAVVLLLGSGLAYLHRRRR